MILDRSMIESWTGRIFLFAIATLAIAIYSFSIFQFDFWRQYFFYDSQRIVEPCEVRAYRSLQLIPDLQSLGAKDPQKVALPHSLDTIIKAAQGDGEFIHAIYHCKIPLEQLDLGKSGISYLHFGWIIGDKVAVELNGQNIARFEGADKLSVPVPDRDRLIRPLDLKIIVSSFKPQYMGVCGNAPFVSSTGNLINNKVFGLEFGLQQTRQLYGLLPALTLGIFLLVAWLLGLRSSLVIISAGFIVMTMLRNTVLLWSEFWPWSVFKSYQINFAFQLGTITFYLLFALDLIGMLSGRLLIALGSATTLVLLQLIVVSFSLFNLPTNLMENFNYSLNLLGCAVLLYLKPRQREKFSLSRQKINRAFVVTILIFALLSLVDLYFIHARIPVRLALKIELMMPLFIVGTVFYVLALMEKEFREEKASRALLERDLELAKEIQDSLSSPEQSLALTPTIKIQCFQKKHQKVAGDWLALRQDGATATIVLADATGKGMQAALVVHAIQSLWAQSLEQSTFSPRDWLQMVNATLFRLGKKQAHSATIGLLQVGAQGIEYWSAGHVPVFLLEGGTKVRSLSARGGVIGLSADLVLESSRLDFKEAVTRDIILGTDGVFANGSRTRPSEVIQIAQALSENAKSYIDQHGADDDRTIVHIRFSTDPV